MNVKKAVIQDRLQINKNDVLSKEDFETLFLYSYGEDFFTTIETDKDNYYLPSNAVHKLTIEELDDKRIIRDIEPTPVFVGTLRPEQDDAISQFFVGNTRTLTSGLLQADPGFGKTYCACSLVARAGITTLILVHTKLLFYQWIEELQKLVPNQEIGMIGDGKFSVKPITVAIYLSANNNIDKIRDEFSLLIVDEAHRCPAETFAFTINNIAATYKIAVTATPSRKDGHHVVFSDYFTDKKVVAKDTRVLPTPSFKIIQTETPFVVFSVKKDWAEQLTKLGDNKKYIELIANNANALISQGRCLLIQGERVAMLRELSLKIPGSRVLVGETPQATREEILENAGKTVTAILTTKIFDEGISCHRLDTNFLTCPSNNPEKLAQRIGRIVRLHPDKQYPLIVDFWLKGHIVYSQQTKRLHWYTAKGYKNESIV